MNTVTASFKYCYGQVTEMFQLIKMSQQKKTKQVGMFVNLVLMKLGT